MASLGGSSTRESITWAPIGPCPLCTAPRRPRRRILPGASGRRGPHTRVAAALHCLDTLLKTDSHGVPLRASAMVCNSFSDKSAKEGAIVVVCIVNGTHSLAIYGAGKLFYWCRSTIGDDLQQCREAFYSFALRVFGHVTSCLVTS